MILRSEERRVGEEGRSRWSPYHLKKKAYTKGIIRSTCFFFFQAEDGIRDLTVTGVQTCALPISHDDGGVVSDELHRDGIDQRGDRRGHFWQDERRHRLDPRLPRAPSVGDEDDLEIGRASCRGRG